MRLHRINALLFSANVVIGTSACLLLQAAPALAQDRANIDRTQIIGNRELPKVLYIVPWKKPVAGDLSGRPIDSVLDFALITDPAMRDPALMAKLDAVAGRVLSNG